MGKIERENRRALFRVRAREMRIRGRMVRILFLAVLAAVTVSALVGTDQSGMAGNQVHMMYLPVFVSWGMTAGILYGIAATWNYREGNRLLGMYPQNNRTRFWSYVLLMHAGKQRCQFVIGIVVQRLLQIKRIYGFDNALSRNFCNSQRNQQHTDQHDGNHGQNIQESTQHGTAGIGNAQYTAISGAHGIINGGFSKGS